MWATHFLDYDIHMRLELVNKETQEFRVFLRIPELLDGEIEVVSSVSEFALKRLLGAENNIKHLEDTVADLLRVPGKKQA